VLRQRGLDSDVLRMCEAGVLVQMNDRAALARQELCSDCAGFAVVDYQNIGIVRGKRSAQRREPFDVGIICNDDASNVHVARFRDGVAAALDDVPRMTDQYQITIRRP
jgi:hypothetical protein